ncbi:MAG: PHB depolymerase family esterase [Burkholderiales bacterium]
MARRSLWAASLQRTLKALTRAGTRAVRASVKKAARKTKKKAAHPPATRRAGPAERWLSGVAPSAAGARRYRLFKPPGSRRAAPLPLFVLLHGCDQDAASAARSTRIGSLAAREGFIVLCPEQDRLANPHGCWNWFEMRSGRAAREAASIIAAIDQACAMHGADPARVAIAGLSAGASMAALLGASYPARFRAVAMHSGVAPGAASSAAGAMRAMRGHGAPPALPTTTALPPLLVIQGTRDSVVAPANGRIAAHWWAAAASAAPTAMRKLQRGQRYAMTVTDFKAASRIAVTLCEIDGLAHHWSGGVASLPYGDAKGPDAARMIWAFAARAFKARA